MSVRKSTAHSSGTTAAFTSSEVHKSPNLVNKLTTPTMSSSAPKSVLCIGINPSKRDTEATKTAGPSPEIRATVNKQIEDAKLAGYELHVKYIAPDEMDVEIPVVREMLREKAWDGFIVGGGIKKVVSLNVYFERLVNAGRELRPEAKMGFTTSADDMVAAMQRMFGE